LRKRFKKHTTPNQFNAIPPPPKQVKNKAHSFRASCFLLLASLLILTSSHADCIIADLTAHHIIIIIDLIDRYWWILLL
jgi:hypothetical protein